MGARAGIQGTHSADSADAQWTEGWHGLFEVLQRLYKSKGWGRKINSKVTVIIQVVDKWWPGSSQ